MLKVMANAGNFSLLRPYHGMSIRGRNCPGYPEVHRFAAGAAKTGVYVNPN
jgi:hypothetical protein